MDSLIDNFVVDVCSCRLLQQQSTSCIVGLSILYIDVFYNILIDFDSLIHSLSNVCRCLLVSTHFKQLSTNAIVGIPVLYIDNM